MLMYQRLIWHNRIVGGWDVIRVGTVLPFSVFFGFRVFSLFIRVSGRVFGPDLLREKSLYQMLGKNQGNIDNILIYSYYINGQYNQE